MKNSITCVIMLTIVFTTHALQAQTISLDECLQKAIVNHPLSNNFKIYNKLTDLSSKIINKRHYPQLSLNSEIKYLSEVTSLNSNTSNIFNDDLFSDFSKDQYSIYIQMEQVIWDAGMTNLQKRKSRLEYNIEKSRLEVDLYHLKKNIIDLFLNIILIEEKEIILNLKNKTLTELKKTTDLAFANGYSSISDLKSLELELLKIKLNEIKLSNEKRGLIDQLSIYIGEDLENVMFRKPNEAECNLLNFGNRPEYEFFNAQIKLLNSEKEMINCSLLPSVSFWGIGAYGNTGLNFLNNKFRFYGYVGIKLNWNIGEFYYSKKRKNLLNTRAKLINNTLNEFEYSQRIKDARLRSEINKSIKLQQINDQILNTFNTLLESKKTEFNNGSLLLNELLSVINEFEEIKINKEIHNINLIYNIYIHKYINVIKN